MGRIKHEQITGAIIEAACKVHSYLGPGLLEHPYLVCLKHEIAKAGLTVVSEMPLPIVYDGIVFDCAYRVDLLVEDQVIVELKAVTEVRALHKAQLLSYLRLADKPVGLLLNFHVPSLKLGLHRIIA